MPALSVGGCISIIEGVWFGAIWGDNGSKVLNLIDTKWQIIEVKHNVAFFASLYHLGKNPGCLML